MADEFRKLTDERVRDGAARVTLIERSILMLLVVGLLIGVLAIVKPFTTAILFGASLATAAWPLARRHRDPELRSRRFFANQSTAAAAKRPTEPGWR